MIRLAVLFAKSKWIGRFENMKKITCIILIQISLSVLCALDYRQVLFGNNYERIEKVTDENVVETYSSKLKDVYAKVLTDAPFRSGYYGQLNYFRLYKETFANAQVYRLLGCSEPITDIKIENMSLKTLSQLVFFQREETVYVVDYAVQHYTPEGGGMYTAYFTDDYYGLETIVRNNVLKGIMKHQSENMKEIHYEEGTNDKTIEYSGFSNANYYEWKDLQNPKKYTLVKDNVYLFDGCHNRIEIKSTRPLIDTKRPLMYTIQNAFDGNPATAYVENTDDDLFSISINDVRTKDPKKEEITKIKIINGYSRSENFYVFNNRIKSISHYNWKTKANDILAVKDTPFIFQEIDYISGACNFEVKEFYKGSKYSDTCLSEVDFYYKKFGWLFRN